MGGYPKISIIVPSLNQGTYIEQTIQSLLNQKYPELEVLVIDGGSTDQTIGILQSFSNQIHWISEKDNGQADAINKGLRISTGEICGFLNSDDLLLPGALQAIAEVFQSTRSLWVTGDYQIMNPEGKKIHQAVVFYKRLLRLFCSKTLLMLTNFIVQPSTFWRRELMDQIGYFDENLRFVMDYDYWVRAFKVGSPKVLRKPLSAFRIHSASKGGSQYTLQFNEEMQVLSRYTNNRMIIFLHKLHNAFIVESYKLIK